MYINVAVVETLIFTLFLRCTMKKVFWNNREIPQPQGAHIDSTDGRVFIYLDEGKPIRKSRKVTVGHATSETMMHPNDTFRQLYPALWKEHYGDKGLKPHVLHCGAYALFLGIGWTSDLYPALNEVYGPQVANLTMDYAMHSILQHTNVAETFHDRMHGEVLFSEKLYDDTRLSLLFSEDLNEESTFAFRDAWLKRCVMKGLRKVWLCIDGSNNDCNVSDSEIVGEGKAKSHLNTGIVGYMYAVSAEDGLPVTYMVYNGGKVDAKALQEMITYLDGQGISVEGVILDRGFCVHDVFELLNRLGYPFIVMLKSNVDGHVEMMSEYGERIRWNVEYLVGMNGLFGISGSKKLFKNHPEGAFISLFYDGKNGSERSVALLNKVFAAIRTAKEELKNTGQTEIPEDMKKYLSIIQGSNGYNLQYNFNVLQKNVDVKGYCSIASSADLPPEEVNRLYHLRDASETQYMILKSQLGCSVTRVHSTCGIKGKFAACFVAAIIRNEISKACKEKGLATNKMLLEIARIELLLNGNGLYSAVHDESSRQKDLLASFNIKPEDFDHIAREVNQRLGNPVHSQVRFMPEPKSDLPPRVGRPAGTTRKNDAAPGESKPKRRKGRPKGSKNKKTIARLKASEPQDEKAKRGVGRPKGSKNKPQTSGNLATEKRGRGRPKGSKNKKKA